MLSFKVSTVGSSCGIILNQAEMARLGVKKGDTLYLTEGPDGAWRISTCNPEFARRMQLAEEIMADDREVLRALAK